MSKQRFNFAFNMDSPDHARAYVELMGWPPRKRGEYIIQAILKQADMAHLKTIVREAVGEALEATGTVAIAPTQEPPPKPIPPPAPLQEAGSEIPASQLNFLMTMAGGGAKM